jgi:hypothetical protein
MDIGSRGIHCKAFWETKGLFAYMTFLSLAFCHSTLLVITPGRAAHDNDREPLICDKSFQLTKGLFAYMTFLSLAPCHNTFLVVTSVRAAHDKYMKLPIHDNGG